MSTPVIASPTAEALVNAAFDDNLLRLPALLDEGMDVNQQDEYGSTALHWAAQHGNVDMVNALLFRGADVRLKDNGGEDAVYLATDNGHSEIVRLLNQAAHPEA